MKRIAIPINNDGNLDQHFGHCPFFEIFDVEGKEIIKQERIEAPAHEPGLLPKFLSEKGVTDILAGGMGQRAITLFNQNGVNAFVGAPQLKAENIVAGFINQTLSFTGNYCDH